MLSRSDDFGGIQSFLRGLVLFLAICAVSFQIGTSIYRWMGQAGIDRIGLLGWLLLGIFQIILLIPSTLWRIIAHVFFVDTSFSLNTGALKPGGYFVFGFLVFVWLLFEVLAHQPERPPEPAKPLAASPPHRNPLITLDKFLEFLAKPIVILSELFTRNTQRERSTPMEQEPLEELQEQVVQVRELYPELNLSQVPRLAVERRSWLEALQDRIQYTRDMRTTNVATAALESKLSYIRKLVELEELATKKEQSGLTREQIKIDKDLLAKRKETELAKIEADTEEHILRKAQAQKAITDLKTPPKAEPQSQPARDPHMEHIARAFRRVELVAEIEKQRAAWKTIHPDLSDFIDRIADDKIEDIKGDHR